VSYGARQSSDFAKLTELSSGGRSTDTTILSMSLIRRLRNDQDLLPKARKLLSFTDNRQDASLQAVTLMILWKLRCYASLVSSGESE
jgi:hypothetical protein